MRTYFEPEDVEAFEAGKDLLIRRCMAWAEDQGQTVDPFALSAALDFRHYSVDGRLGYWTTELVEEFLLSYVPRALSITAQDAVALPDTVRLLGRYLHATGLADPTGDPLTDLDQAITKAAADFPAAMADEHNFGPAKFWMMTATRHGVDPTDDAAMNTFLDDARAGRVGYDDEVLTHIAARHVREAGWRTERAVVQLPVSLPPEDELAAVAESIPVVRRLRALADWVGDGRTLTTTGNIKLADARELVALADTGDTVDPCIGERVFHTKSSAELRGLTHLIDVAKKIRLVRVVKNRLVRVAKATPLLRDSLALWSAAFDALPIAGLLVPPNSWAAEHTRMLDSILDEVLPDVLNTVYGLPEPMPVIRLAESVWAACTEMSYLDTLDPASMAQWREGVSADLRRLLDVLTEFGAVELTTGRPDPMYFADLAPDWELETGEPAPLAPEVRARLRDAMDPDAGPVELISLTPLATRAVRARLLREGRYAPLVGELSDAGPAQLLGMVAEHYSPETANAEIAGWLATRGGWERGLARLLDGIRRCPFRTRAAAMLDVLAHAAPDRPVFLHELRADPHIGPIVSLMLVEDGEITLDELAPDEGLRAMTEQFLQLLEMGGTDTVAATLSEIPSGQAHDMLAAMLASGHPDRTGLAELDALTQAQRGERRTGGATMHSLAGVSRSGRGHRKQKRRH